MQKLKNIFSNTLILIFIVALGLASFLFLNNLPQNNEPAAQVPQPQETVEQTPTSIPTTEETVTPTSTPQSDEPADDTPEPTWTPVIIIPRETPLPRPSPPPTLTSTPVNPRETLITELKTTTGNIAVSPDGNDLVFTQLNSNETERQLWKFSLANKQLEMLADAGVKPQWSQTEGAILFERAYWDDNSSEVMIEIKVIDQNERNEKTLITKRQRELLDYYWNESNTVNIVSPTGIENLDLTGRLTKQIELILPVDSISNSPLPRTDGSSGRFTIFNSDGRLQIFQHNGNKVIIDGPPGREASLGRQYIGDFKLAPNQQHIAYIVYEGSIETLWMTDVAGKEQNQLFELAEGGTITAPQWSPNSQSLVIGHRPRGIYDGPSYELTLIQLEGGQTTALGVDKVSNFIWSPDGKHLYYTRAILIDPSATYSVSLHQLRVQQ